jgi:hypothetical protein
MGGSVRETSLSDVALPSDVVREGAKQLGKSDVQMTLVTALGDLHMFYANADGNVLDEAEAGSDEAKRATLGGRNGLCCFVEEADPPVVVVDVQLQQKGERENDRLGKRERDMEGEN